MRTTAICALALAGALLTTSATAAGLFDKTGQAGMTFLKIGPVARAAGMGDAQTAVSMGAISTFYNPAGLGYLRGRLDATVNRVNWIADIGITSAAVGVPIRIGAGSPLAVVAASYVSMDYGTVHGTVIDKDAPDSYREVGTLDPSESVLGLTLARQFTDKFSLGATAKYVTQTLPWYSTGYIRSDGTAAEVLNSPSPTRQWSSVSALVLDAGTMYRTGFGSSVISMSIRNFARRQQYELDGFRLPVTLNIGVSMDAFDLVPALQRQGHRLTIAADGLHPPDHPEKLALGGEYAFRDMFSLRGGYDFNCDARRYSLGAGVKYSVRGVGAAFDYAYSDFGGTLGAVNYFGLSFSI